MPPKEMNCELARVVLVGVDRFVAATPRAPRRRGATEEKRIAQERSNASARRGPRRWWFDRNGARGEVTARGRILYRTKISELLNALQKREEMSATPLMAVFSPLFVFHACASEGDGEGQPANFEGRGRSSWDSSSTTLLADDDHDDGEATFEHRCVLLDLYCNRVKFHRMFSKLDHCICICDIDLLCPTPPGLKQPAPLNEYGFHACNLRCSI